MILSTSALAKNDRNRKRDDRLNTITKFLLTIPTTPDAAVSFENEQSSTQPHFPTTQGSRHPRRRTLLAWQGSKMTLHDYVNP